MLRERLAFTLVTPGPRNSLRRVLPKFGETLEGLPATVAAGSTGLAKDAGSNHGLPPDTGLEPAGAVRAWPPSWWYGAMSSAYSVSPGALMAWDEGETVKGAP